MLSVARYRVGWRHAIMLPVLSACLLAVLATPSGGGVSASKLAARQAVAGAESKISAELLAQLNRNPSAKVRYIAVLAAQADTTNNIVDWTAKGRYVLNTLRHVANTSQPPVAALLTAQQRAGNVASYKSYYIINAFQVRGNLASAQALSALPEIARIEVFPQVTIDPPIEEGRHAPQAIEWNVARVRAPQAWAMGYDGTGVVVGSLDTGVRYTHNALRSKYRGNLGGGAFDHNYNWWDVLSGRPAPYDDNGHGTHTTGTILGDDSAGNQVGVAPGATWIATNGIADGVSDADIIEGGQFMLAPWNLSGQNPDPDKRPAVVGNSWGYGTNLPYPGCLDATFFRSIVLQWRNAGIFPSFSAGNGTYGNRPPAAYPETFETGSINILDVRSYFSSQGPSCYDSGQHPQLVAGGEGVRSASSAGDSSYENLSGTSMAQPSLAGAVAILKQANPNLTIEQTWYILTSTTTFSSTWGVRPSVEYGWGLLQIDAAVQAALAMVTPTPTWTGTPPTATATRTRTRTPTITPTVPTATATSTPACQVTYMSGDTPRPIPDLLTVTSTLTVVNGPVISSLDVVELSIFHTYPEDMNLYLISPSGTRVKLFSDVCGSGDWTPQNTGFDLSDGATTSIGEVCPPGQGTYRPQEALAGFAGEPSSGTWVLEITDDTAQDVGLLNSWGLRVNSSTPCAATATPTPEPVLVGHVDWEGREPQPDPGQMLPITLTLKSGSTEVHYPQEATDANGYFTVELGSLPEGTYNWRVKGPHGGSGNTTPGFLANAGSVDLTGAPVTNAEMGTMRAGDANNDNVVEVEDFNLLRNSFGRQSGDPEYDARADFNGDGTVEVLDFNLLKRNFGQAGAPPLLPMP